MVYSAGVYGDGAAADIQNILRTTAADYGICLAVMARIPSAATDADYDYIVDTLAADVKARIVIAYLQTSDQPGLFEAITRKDKAGWFVWIASDSMSNRVNSGYGDVLDGFFYVDLPSAVIPGLQDYVRSLIYNGTSNIPGDQVCYWI